MKRITYTLLATLLTLTANADNSVPQNKACNQACLTLTTGEAKYYNTSQLESITADGNKLTVTTTSQEQDVYDATVKNLTFAKKTIENVQIGIDFDGSTATITGDTDLVSISSNGAHVTVTSAIDAYLDITLKGSTTNGSLLVYSQKKYGITLSGVSINNPQGPAINNQCGKSLYVTLTQDTDNTLADGTAYAEAAIDQKGTLFSEGQIYFQGTGSLTVNGNAKNGIASDDYIVFESGNISVSVASTGSNGVKVNDGLQMKGGTLNIGVKADGARGIKDDGYLTISGGITTITTSGDCLIETIEGVRDTTSCAGIKCDSLFNMTAGELTITSTGDGGKGINCSHLVVFEGGTMNVSTTGSNDEGKPKAVKSDMGIILSGGSFRATCKKSWACDNGTDSETPSERVTVVGTPKTAVYEKRRIEVAF